MKLPKEVWSQLGPVPIRFVAIAVHNGEKDEDAFGVWSMTKRDIQVVDQCVAETQLATLMHEMTHIALSDAGGENVLTHQQTEFVCDALGSYLAGAILAGYIKLQVPK